MRSISRSFLLATLLSLALCPLSGQMRVHGRYVLSSTDVIRMIAEAFTRDYPDAREPTVQLLADVTSNEATPLLEIERASMLKLPSTLQSGQRLAVRVRCRTVSICLPFYAVVSCPQALSTTTIVVRRGTEALVTAPILVRQGAHVTLLLTGRGITLEVPVVLLQSGASGASVRAISLDRRQVYTAQVYSEGLLKGAL